MTGDRAGELSGERSGPPDVETLLDEAEFEPDGMFLTRRQATVLALREGGEDQGTIADRLDCSRANVSNIERSARKNIEKARTTLAFADLLGAPVRVELPAGLPVHEAPERIYGACDEAGVKVNYGAPELIREISSQSAVGTEGGTLTDDVVIAITEHGEIHVMAGTPT